ncbi:MAG TPA: lipid-A-disaccharide synthase [Terriglobales bacterium]|nr:lipid-A-disaccharide synthase [Terriglobales bacterium]
MRILISAGEASGDMYGAQLIEACERLAGKLGPGNAPASSAQRDWSTASTGPQPAGPLEFFGAGGNRMRAAGLDVVVDARELAVVGITEILGHLPKIYRLFAELIADADKRRPDLAVVIDSPAFNWRVARQMHRRGIPVVYYVCPQFWAWRQGRVRFLRNYVDKALVIFPFEEKFYRDRGVDATFIGHPLLDLPMPSIARASYAAQHGLDPAKPWITLMPGSRVKEVRMNLPTILEAASQLGAAYEFLLPVAPTLNRAWFESLIGKGALIRLVSESLTALTHSRGGIIASGTATVEAAIVGTPFVMVYKVSPLTYVLGRPWVKVPHLAMVNLIAGREVVPELVQGDFSAQNVVHQLGEILPDGPARARMIEGLAKVRESLRGPDHGKAGPAERAAEMILRLRLERRR